MTDQPTLIVTRGLPASGKTTWARAWVADAPAQRARVNRDDLRAMLFAAPDYGHRQESIVTTVQRATVKNLLAAGWDVVADDTNLRVRYVREWARFARANRATLAVFDFPIDPDEAVRRDAARDRTVGESVIRGMAARYLRKGALPTLPTDLDGITDDDHGAPYTPPAGAPRAVIVDLDGTTALNTSGRGYYGPDLLRVGEDTPNRGIIEAVRAAHAYGETVIYLTSRDDEHDGQVRAATQAWIDQHIGVPGPLHMRPAGDKRKDAHVKRDLFDRHVRDVFDVTRVYDDRRQVVEAWRAMGLTVCQVAEGDF